MGEIIKKWDLIADVINLLSIPVFLWTYFSGGNISDLVFWGILVLI